MSYEGIGQLTLPTTLFKAAPTSTPAPAPVGGGIPQSLVSSLRLAFAFASKQPWGTNTATPYKLNATAVLLGALKPNSAGLIPVTPVQQLLANIPATLYPYVNRYLSGVTIASVLADIAGGKYATPTTKTTLSSGSLLLARTSAVQKTAVAQQMLSAADQAAAQARTAAEAQAAAAQQAAAQQAAAEAAAAQQAAEAAAALAQQQTQQSGGGAQAVECTDGYYRDASGLCVPGAAPPAAQPNLMIDDAYGPPGSGTQPSPGAQPGSSASLTPGERKFLGIGIKWWVLGGATAGVAAIALRSRKVTPNRRRHR